MIEIILENVTRLNGLSQSAYFKLSIERRAISKKLSVNSLTSVPQNRYLPKCLLMKLTLKVRKKIRARAM